MAMQGKQGGAARLTVAAPTPPKGGGTIRGMGESVAADAFSGSASLTIPIAFPEARDSVPPLALSYRSGGGNGVFGSGFDIGLPRISRQTSKRVPRYDDGDVFVHALLGELVRTRAAEAVMIDGVAFRTSVYRQRLESDFVAIEHRVGGGRDFWCMVDGDNVTWLFGVDPAAQVADPADAAHIFSWLLQESFDARGNHVLYEYGADHANRHLTRVHWGNRLPMAPSMLLTLDARAIDAVAWHFHAVFDYGGYDTMATNPYRSVGGPCTRADPFSQYAAGFEIRTEWLCRALMIFHEFTDELGPDPRLVRVIRLSYDENPYLSTLVRVEEVGFRTDAPAAGGTRTVAPMAPLELTYSGFAPFAGAYRPLLLDGGRLLAEDVFEWVDLYGVGIPGLLHVNADGVRFWEASRVDASAGTVQYAGPLPVAPAPLGAQAGDGRFTLADVVGAGRPQWYSRSSACPGYADIGIDGGGGPWHAFERLANDQGNPARHVVDVTGTGLPDLLLIASDRVEYTPCLGRVGYGPTRMVPPSGLPVAVGDAPGDARRFADVFGSGQMHYVRIQNGAITVWPNLGYGRFGAPVRLENAPWLGVDFDPARLFLVALDGSGPVDLLYLDAGGLRYFRNRAGNGFDAAIAVPLPTPADALMRLDVADLLGAGVPSLVVTQLGPLFRQWYLPVNEGARPNMLAGVTNNLGHVTRLAYATSSQAWLADRGRGIPWLTVPPMPVSLLTRVTDRDELSDTNTTRGFTYRHGYYDGEERAFAGFAFVEETDAEYVGEAAACMPDDACRVPPCVTRRWQLNGAAPGGAPLETLLAKEYFAGDSGAYRMPPALALFVDRNGDTVRQARYAERGQLLREEVYGADGSPLATTPYHVQGNRHQVSQLLSPGDGQPSVFFVRPLESIHYQYERDPADPRVHHEFTLAVDDFGQVTEACAVAYPRRGGGVGVPAQQLLAATRTRSTYFNVTTPFRLLGVLDEAIDEQVNGLVPDDRGYLGLDALLEQLTAATFKRLSWSRYSYVPDTGGAALAPQRLLTAVATAEFESAALTECFAPALDASALTALLSGAGGYLSPENPGAADYWWSPGDSFEYANAAGFYRPRRTTDPFGATTAYRDDAYGLFVVGMTDALGNTTSVTSVDYQALQPATVVDPNQAVFEAGFDAQGRVVVTSVYGSQGGERMGFSSLSAYRWPASPVMISAVLAAPASYLQNAATIYVYDVLAWCGQVRVEAFAGLGIDTLVLWADLVAAGYLTQEGAVCDRFRQAVAAGRFALPMRDASVVAAVADIIAGVPSARPVAALALAATVFPGASNTTVGATLAFTDGFGRMLQIKTLADEPQPTLVHDAALGLHAVPATRNWLTSGGVRYNAKGEPMRQFEPFFSATSAYDPLEAANDRTSCTTFWYDAVGRRVRAETPLGTDLRMVYGAVAPEGVVTDGAWDVVHFDANDTIKESAYYRALMADPAADPYQKAAALQAALANGSPTRAVLDPQGRLVRTIAQNDGLVTQAGLETLSLGPAEAASLLADLMAAGYLDPRGAPTVAFTADVPGWTVSLPAPFTQDADKVTRFVAGVQAAGTLLATDIRLDIQGRPLSIADPRLAAAGAANATVVYSLSGAPVLFDAADAGPRWRLANAKGQEIYTRDGNGNASITDYDVLQRVSKRRLFPASGPAIVTTVALYGDSTRTIVPGGAQVPYFATPETWNLRGLPVALFDAAGLALSPFATFHRLELAHRRWIRIDATAQPDWNLADETVLQALADEIGALPTPAALPSLALPSAVQAMLDNDGHDGASAYDALGRTVARTDADGNVTEATFNARGLIEALTFTPAQGAMTTVAPIIYNAHAQPVGYGVEGVFTTLLDYDRHTSLLSGIQTRSDATPKPADPLRQSLRYYRDPVGQVIFALDEAAPPSGQSRGSQPTQSFGYDLLYRLIVATGREASGGTLVAYTERYGYDDSGNALSVSHRGGNGDWSRSFSVERTTNRLAESSAIGSSPASERFAYDANGNLATLYGLEDLHWTYLNRIASSTTTPAADGSYQRVDHVYSGSGQRVRSVRQTFASGGMAAVRTEVTTWLDALEITRIREGDATAPVTGEWHVNRMSVGVLMPAQWQQWYVGMPPGQPGGAMRYPLVDVVGSVRQLLDAQGAPLTWREYLPYGTDASAWASSDTDAVLQRRRFGGQEYDSETGLYEYTERHYAPQLMRWMSADPAGAIDAINLYQFVRGNPSTYADADGRITIHHWNVENATMARLAEVSFVKEVANQLNAAYDPQGTVVFLTEVLHSVTLAAFNTFVDQLNAKSTGGWTGRLLYAGKSQGGTRREKIAILTNGVDVQNYFQLVAEHHTNDLTVKETHPTGAFTKAHAFNERQIVGVDIQTRIGGARQTLSIGGYHNQGPSSGAPERAGRWRRQAARHKLHAVIGDWNVKPDMGNQKKRRRLTRNNGFGEEVTFDRTPTSRGGSVYDYALSFNSDVGTRKLMVRNRAGVRGSSDHRQNSATLTTRKRTRDD